MGSYKTSSAQTALMTNVQHGNKWKSGHSECDKEIKMTQVLKSQEGRPLFMQDGKPLYVLAVFLVNAWKDIIYACSPL